MKNGSIGVDLGGEVPHHYEILQQDRRCLQIRLFSSLVLKGLNYNESMLIQHCVPSGWLSKQKHSSSVV